MPSILISKTYLLNKYRFRNLYFHLIIILEKLITLLNCMFLIIIFL